MPQSAPSTSPSPFSFAFTMASPLGFSTAASLATRSVTPNNTLNANSSRCPLPVVQPRLPRSPNAVTMAFSSIEGVLTPDPVAMPDDLALVIKAVYTQVFGNAYLMDSERAELASAESQFVMSGNVREFVRALALSEQYKSRFFYSVSQYRFVELAFKHFLGRAPESKSEYALAMSFYNEKGYEAFLSCFIDSVEYEETFGTSFVPYGIYKGCYSSNELFNRSVAMRLAPGCSDKGRSALLQYCVLSGDSPSWLTIAKALAPGTEKGTGYVIGSYWQSSTRNEKATVRVGTRVPGGVVFF